MSALPDLSTEVGRFQLLLLGFVAVALAAMNVVGGYLVTHRMLAMFRDRAPGMPYAHPTVEHFAPLFVTLGAASDAERAPDTEIEGFFLGLAKRSFQIA